MLLVHPVLEVIKFLPFVIGVFVLGSSGNDKWWQLLGVAVPIALGVMRYITTRYRITPTQVELQRGLISRNVLTARLDRVRAVELTSSLIHRVLGLGKVEIGTASAASQGDDKFVLDGLPLAQAREMRAALLHRTSAQPHRGRRTLARTTPPKDQRETDEVLMQLDHRLGPLRAADLFGQRHRRRPAGRVRPVRRTSRRHHQPRTSPRAWSGDCPSPSWWPSFWWRSSCWARCSPCSATSSTTGATPLSRDAQGRSFHIRRGLFTSRETSLERERVRGVELVEPLGLRMAGAGRLNAVVTGLSRSERSSTQLVPPAPRRVVEGVAPRCSSDAIPIEVPLRQHGPAARRRRYTRALIGGVVLPVAVVVLCLATPVPWWV